MKRLGIVGLLQGALIFGALPPQKPIKIESPIINLVNGTSFIDIEGLINFRLKVREMHWGVPKKICTYKGVECSVDDLIRIEDQPDADAAELKKALAVAVTHFEKVSEPHIRDAAAARHFTVKIISRWAEQRNRPNSHLNDWARCSPAEERILFRRDMTTFKKLAEFCEDLSFFLIDLIYSCDKSYQKYREKKAAENAGKKSELGEHFEAIEHADF